MPKIPAISVSQMREADRLMVEHYGISLLQMMENAGRNLAGLAADLLTAHGSNGGRIAVLCGAGNNGGGGMVAARHLHNRGHRVTVALTVDEGKLSGAAAHQWDILQKMEVPLVHEASELKEAALIIDAIIGYGLRGNPRAPVSEWIEVANASKRPILALDVPSGLDGSSGRVGRPCIKAAATMTLALPKTGLFVEGARGVVGDLYLADISVPRDLYKRMGLDVPGDLFSKSSIIPLG